VHSSHAPKVAYGDSPRTQCFNFALTWKGTSASLVWPCRKRSSGFWSACVLSVELRWPIGLPSAC